MPLDCANTRLPWPCFLKECISSNWDPEDRCFEFWRNVHSGYTPESLNYAQFVELTSSLTSVLRKHLELIDDVSFSAAIYVILWHPHILIGVAVHSVVQAGAVFYPMDIKSFDVYTFDGQIAGIICLTSISDLPHVPEGFVQYVEDTELFRRSDWCLLLRKPLRSYLYVSKSPNSRMAYVISTSGSSSLPRKMVFVADSCLSANVVDLTLRFTVAQSANNAVLLTAPLTFDPSLVQLYFALATKRRLVIANTSLLWTPGLLRVLCVKSGVDWLQCTPSMFVLQSDHDQRELLSLRQLNILFGGEPFPSYLFRNFTPEASIFGLYGVTEVSCWATIYHLNPTSQSSNLSIWCTCKPPSENSTPIGFPMLATTTSCEIHSGVSTLELGRTFGGFVVLPNVPKQIDYSFYCELVERLSCPSNWSTGDKVLPGKCTRCLWFSGRADRMVKRLGHRICLDELEQCMLRCYIPRMHIRFCRCSVVSAPSATILVATVSVTFRSRTPYAPRTTSERRLRSRLLSHIKCTFSPSYLPWFPDAIKFSILSPAISNHGKLKRSLTPHFWFPSTVQLSRIWRTCFGTSSSTVSPQHTFNSTGGSSLSVVHFVHTLLLRFPFFASLKNKILSIIFNNDFGTFVKYIRAFRRRNKKETSKKRQLQYTSTSITVVSEPKVVHDSIYQYSKGNFLNTPKNLTLKFRSRWNFSLNRCVDASAIISSCLEDSYNPTLVFVGSHSGMFAAINLMSGENFWLCEREFNGDRIEAGATMVSMNGSPFVSVGTLSGRLHAIDVASGTHLWSFPSGGAIKAPPLALPELGLLIFGSHSRLVHAIDPRTPVTPIWSASCDGSPVVSTISRFRSPSKLPFEIFVTTLGGSLACIDFRNSTEAVWLYKGAAPVFTSAVCHDFSQSDNRVAFCDVAGNIISVAAHSGELLYDTHLPSVTKNCNVFNDPIVNAFKQLIIPSSSGSLFAADLYSGRFLWEMDCRSEWPATSPCQLSTPSLLQACSWESPHVVFSRADGHICICQIPPDDTTSLFKMSCVSEFSLNAPSFSSPVLHYDAYSDTLSVVIGGRDDFLHCLTLD